MKLLTKIKQWFKSLLNKASGLTDKYLPVAVNVVQAVKKAIESGTVDVIADIVKSLIVGTADDIIIDRIVVFAKKRIPALCIQLEILEISKASGGDAEVLTIALNKLRDTYGDKWESFTSGLAGDLVEYLSDGKIDAREAALMAKKYYDENIKGNNNRVD